MFRSQVAIQRHLKDAHNIITSSPTRNVANIRIRDSSSPRRVRIKHRCALCLKMFRSKVGIERHLKEVHNGGISSTSSQPMIINVLGTASVRQVEQLTLSVDDSASTSNVDKKSNTRSPRVLVNVLETTSLQVEQVTQTVDELAVKSNVNKKSNTRQPRIQVKHTCALCSKTFRSKVGIERHLKEAHDGVVAPAKTNESDNFDDKFYYTCDNCGKKFVDKVKLNRHLKKYSKTCTKMSVCDVCGKEFTNPRSMRRHRNTDHEDHLRNDDQLWGGTAISTTTAEDELADSLVVMIDNKKYYQCDLCPYIRNSRNRIIEHHRTHTGERPYFCEKCGKQFNNRTLLRNHLLGVHEGVRKFTCDICSKTFSSKHYVDEHRRIHTGEKPFVCDLCGSAYTHLTSLLTHKNRHSDSRKYQCPLCPETFVYRSSLNLHKKRHTGDLRHKCEECGKAFIDKQHLTRHLAVHTNVRPYPCNICGATFKLKKYLGSHKKTHSNKEK